MGLNIKGDSWRRKREESGEIVIFSLVGVTTLPFSPVGGITEKNNNNNNNNSRTGRRNSRVFTISSLPQTISNTYTPVARVQSCANHNNKKPHLYILKARTMKHMHGSLIC